MTRDRNHINSNSSEAGATHNTTFICLAGDTNGPAN